jgi:alpha-mannosidase
MPFSKLTRPWEIFLVHHSHVDIGYTEPQPLIYRMQADFVAQALDYITATENLPEGERFCWTCEVSWTIKNFLTQYPARAEEYFRRVREGRIEVTGVFLQLTDLFGEELLDHSLSYACNLAKEHGFEVVTGMNDDVNGWAWGFPKMMADRGIRYFDTAVNEVRLKIVRPRPYPFYWASPGGEKVLHWHGNMYTQANDLGIGERGKEEKLAKYLKELEDSGYPHNAVELRVLGEHFDNAPPGLWLCEYIREWNRRPGFPKLRLCTPRTWFEHLEKHWPEPIKESRAAWCDWWADGNGSALYESALMRKSQADFNSIEALAKAGGEVDRKVLEEAREAAMFYGEHAFGSWCSTDAPDSLDSRAQWNFHAGYAYKAAVEAEALQKNALLSCVEEKQPKEGVEVTVFNPLNEARTDLVEFAITDYLYKSKRVRGEATLPDNTPEAAEAGPALCLIDDETGETFSLLRRPAITFSHRRPGQLLNFVARNVPALGKRKYRIKLDTAPAPSRVKQGEFALENDCFRLTVDPRAGGVVSLIDLKTEREMLAVGEYALNQHIYETINDPKDRLALCGWQGAQHDVPFRRSSPTLTVKPGAACSFGASLVLEGGGGDAPFLRSEFFLYDELPWIDVFNAITKPYVNSAEAIYHAFPLGSQKQPAVYLDTPGAVLRPGLDQIPGTATDWHGIQHYFAVSDDNYTTVVASPQVPLVQVNGINTGKWQPTLPPPNGLVMSWVMNNYWWTTFPAAQGGTVHFRYSLQGFPGPFDAPKAARFAKTIRQPLLTVVVPSSRMEIQT